MPKELKPYNSNKGFISFRLNPDAIKEALIEQVPYNRTLRHIYNNPEGDIIKPSIGYNGYKRDSDW